jgi:hypothetical protein
MKVLLLLLTFICFFSSLPAQTNPKGAGGAQVSEPLRKAQTTSEIADYINAHYRANDQKVLAIYSWLVNNIKYDNDSLHFVILDEDNEERVTYALRRRKGVCENFAAIFNDLCAKCGIPSFAIAGFTKQGSSIAKAGHMWNAAFVNNEWDLYDPTWDVGSEGNYNATYRYFKVLPSVFIETHLPFDPLFQFLNYPVNYKEFAEGLENSQKPDNYFNYLDSIQNYQKMDRISKYLSEESRIKKMQWPPSKIETRLKTLRFQIEVLNQDDDADLYNAAVEDYNHAINALNVFLTYRNNQFQPAKSTTEINKIFDNISRLIESANFRLQKISRSTATLQLDTGDIHQKINELKSQLQTQELFYKNYTASTKKPD